MTIVVFGIDALDPDIVDTDLHGNLVLNKFKKIETITSSTGVPSTHELWPTIITGQTPENHGLLLEDGVSWDSPFLTFASRIAKYIIPKIGRRFIGNWLLNHLEVDTFQTRRDYYINNNIKTVFSNTKSLAIGIPNFVTDSENTDREYELRKTLGDLFERNSDARGGHVTSDPEKFYNLCMEMAMIRIARTRRGLRSGNYDLVFGYTSGLDLIGHVTHKHPRMQRGAYDELNEFVGELRNDLEKDDCLILVSDHGLQDGIHTSHAMISASEGSLISNVESVTDVYDAITQELKRGQHQKKSRGFSSNTIPPSDEVEQHLKDLGYF